MRIFGSPASPGAARARARPSSSARSRKPRLLCQRETGPSSLAADDTGPASASSTSRQRQPRVRAAPPAIARARPCPSARGHGGEPARARRPPCGARALAQGPRIALGRQSFDNANDRARLCVGAGAPRSTLATQTPLTCFGLTCQARVAQVSAQTHEHGSPQAVSAGCLAWRARHEALASIALLQITSRRAHAAGVYGMTQGWPVTGRSSRVRSRSLSL